MNEKICKNLYSAHWSQRYGNLKMAITKLSNQLFRMVIINMVSRFILSKKIFAKSDFALDQNLCWEEIEIN